MGKKLLLLSFLLCPFFVKAQDAFQKKDLFINAGFSAANYRSHNFPASDKAGKLFPTFISAEYGFSNKISAGPFAGYYFNKFKYFGNSKEDSLNAFVFKAHYLVTGLRATYHFFPLLSKSSNQNLDSENVDLYISALLGYEWNWLTRLDNRVDLKGNSRPLAGLVVGARYFVNHRLAVFGEVGPGLLGVISLGMTARY